VSEKNRTVNDLKKDIEALGYEVYTTNRNVGDAPWTCTIFVGNSQKAFQGRSEERALQEALWEVMRWEEEARVQAARMTCEGCGE